MITVLAAVFNHDARDVVRLKAVQMEFFHLRGVQGTSCGEGQIGLRNGVAAWEPQLAFLRGKLR